MPFDVNLFQQSITQELNVIKNRVRNLIGDAHWGEEGRFKEAILKNIIKQFLPKNLSIGTGFILKADEHDNLKSIPSSQLDIIVYDNTVPVLFSEGDFIITTMTNVRAIIEVKSKIKNGDFKEIVEKFDKSISPFISALNNPNRKKIFTGVFAFEFDDDIKIISIKNALRNSNRIVNHISLGSNFFIRHWEQKDAENITPPVDCVNDFYNIYKLNDLSFSYFISNLIDMTSGGLNDRDWFSYPVPGTKETNKLDTICLGNLNDE